MKLITIISVAAALALAATAQAGAGGASLCKAANAQSGSGQAFASRQECVKSKDVFAPTLTSTPSAFGANQQYVLQARGLHAGAATTIYFAITGQAPYGSYVPYYPTEADGSFSIPFVFAQCGNSPDNLTITIVDSSGVHASVGVTLC